MGTLFSEGYEVPACRQAGMMCLGLVLKIRHGFLRCKGFCALLLKPLHSKLYNYHQLLDNQKINVFQQTLFKAYDITDQEVIAGEDDKHLNFRVSVLKQNDKLFTSTFVQYNNLFGRIYMTIIMPFHKLIVKAMLRNAVKNKRI